MESLTIQKNEINVMKLLAIGALLLPLVLVLILLLSAGFDRFINRNYNVPLNLPEVSSTNTTADSKLIEASSVFAEDLVRLTSRPVKIMAYKGGVEISDSGVVITPKPQINLNIAVVGVTDDGYMETPTNWQEAGWYKKSSKPGEKGNMVINAHYDDSFGRPAGFWGLKNLVEGDTVVVSDEYGLDHTYEVSKVFYVNISDPSRLDILKSENGDSMVTLITCGGVWIPGAGTYNQRLVVQAKLLE